MSIFEQFEQWSSEKSKFLEKEGILITFVQCPPTENSAAYIDIQSEKVFARATLWESMDMSFEAIEANSAKSLIFETQKTKDMQEVFSLLDHFFLASNRTSVPWEL